MKKIFKKLDAVNALRSEELFMMPVDIPDCHRFVWGLMGEMGEIPQGFRKKAEGREVSYHDIGIEIADAVIYMHLISKVFDIAINYANLEKIPSANVDIVEKLYAMKVNEGFFYDSLKRYSTLGRIIDKNELNFWFHTILLDLIHLSEIIVEDLEANIVEKFNLVSKKLNAPKHLFID